jgi:coenzyme F420 biosynthesis associated uncharacterized protein
MESDVGHGRLAGMWALITGDDSGIGRAREEEAGMSAVASVVDWARAEQVAIKIAGRSAAPAAHVAGWDPPIGLIEQQIEDVTGLRSGAGTASADLIDRPTWIRANITSFRQLLDPVLSNLARQRPTAGFAAGALNSWSQQMAGAQLGTMLGWMGGRVLGQYDLLVRGGPVDAGADGAVYLVGPNLATLEQRFGFDPIEFRTWVLVHELTHRAQFTGVPWMRAYFSGLVDELLGAVDPRPEVLFGALRDALKRPDEAGQQVRETGLAGLIASAEQRAVIGRIGGLMSLLEGHGDVTMTRAAGDLVPEAARYARVLAARRAKGNPLTRLLMRLTGMEGKLNQYAAGQRFITAVEAAGGPRAIDACWTSPAMLPSIDEIRDPQQWLCRMARRAA